MSGRCRAATVAFFTIACAVVILTAVGCNLVTPAAQPTAIARILPTSDRVMTDAPVIASTASGVPTSQPAATQTAVDTPEVRAAQPIQTVTAPPAPRAASTEPLFNPDYPLRAGAVDVPLEVRIPALQLRAPVLGVGLTTTNAMASPVGARPNDPIWWSLFWYRGGGIPGEVGTATFAGHYDDDEGRPAIFAYLSEIEVTDVIFVKDTRSGVEIPFIVTEVRTFTREESMTPANLARIFGASSISGAEGQPAPDLVSRLTLITCDGEWIDGSFDQHLVVFATRATYPIR